VYPSQNMSNLDLDWPAKTAVLNKSASFICSNPSILRPPATPKQMKDGFAWACEFGRTDVVDFLLQKGMKLDAKLPHNGQTGLHWAAYGAHASTVKLLLERGAPVDTRDESFDGTPLGGRSMPGGIRQSWPSSDTTTKWSPYSFAQAQNSTRRGLRKTTKSGAAQSKNCGRLAHAGGAPPRDATMTIHVDGLSSCRRIASFGLLPTYRKP
jgi:Ankyrin repeats (many copies)